MVMTEIGNSVDLYSGNDRNYLSRETHWFYITLMFETIQFIMFVAVFCCEKMGGIIWLLILT